MEKLKGALKAGKHVEIERHVAQSSATSAVVAENAARAADANARGEHVARIRREDGSRLFECGVTLREARELLDAGALFIGPASLRP